MKFYIAASFELKSEVKKIITLLESKGHSITHDWTTHEVFDASTQEEYMRREQYALADFEGVKNADVFILLSDPSTGRGKYSELGIALAYHTEYEKPLVYVLGEDTVSNIFYFHPKVKKMKTIDAVLSHI